MGWVKKRETVFEPKKLFQNILNLGNCFEPKPFREFLDPGPILNKLSRNFLNLGF
jgi:hypothetical protein